MKDSVYKEYLKDRKTIMTFVALTIAFVICILLSFGTNFYFKTAENGFITELLISFALCVYCLFFGIPEGKNLHQKKIGGRYDLARRRFLEQREKAIGKDNAFNQWLDKYYEERKREYFTNILTIHGIEQISVLDLDYCDLDKLAKPFKKTWDNTPYEGRKPTYFKSLTEKQIALLKDIYNGKISVEKIPNDYFKTLNGKMVLSEYIEQSRVAKRNNIMYFSLIIYRIIMVFAFAFVFSCFGFEVVQATETGEIIERTVNTLSRIWTMISSFVYGFAVGQVMTVKEAEILEFKCSVNREFNEDKTFVALDQEELAKKEYEKYKKEQAERTVIPEPIPNIKIDTKDVLSLENKEGEYGL